MTNVNRIFIICFWSEQHWLQNETFLLNVWNKKKHVQFSAIHTISKYWQLFTPIPGLNLIALGCDQDMSSVFEVIFHNNVGHNNGTYSKNHGESIHYQCFFWQTAVIFSVSESNDTNIWTSCNMHPTPTCGTIWSATSQEKFYHICSNGWLKLHYVYSFMYQDLHV